MDILLFFGGFGRRKTKPNKAKFRERQKAKVKRQKEK